MYSNCTLHRSLKKDLLITKSNNHVGKKKQTFVIVKENYLKIRMKVVKIPMEKRRKMKSMDRKKEKGAKEDWLYRTKGHEMIYFNSLSRPAAACRPRWRSAEDHLRGPHAE